MPARRTGRSVLGALALMLGSWAGRSLAQAVAPGPAPGTLVNIGAHRLHIRCAGPESRTPTVILEAGGGGSSTQWTAVQALLSERVRSCAYDRAGLGWSDPGPGPRTMRQEVFELHALIEAAKVSRPLVLVGQSIGGLLVRLYAEHHGGEVAGLVLVDPTHESDVLYSLRAGKWVRLRDLASDRAVPEPRREGRASTQYDPAQDYQAEEFHLIYLSRQANPVPLGDRPLIVLAAGRRPAPPGTSEDFWAPLRVEKDGQKIDLSRLSRNSRFVLDPTSGHGIHTDNPQLVARAIEDVLDALAKGGLTAAMESADGQNLLGAVSPPGRLVDVGGYRLHLYCSGTPASNRPTVVLSAGGGDFAIDWWMVQSAVADSSRVCSYDRAGSGWSDLGPEPRTLRQEAAELYFALSRSGERGPWVVVGHSLGGQVVRQFQADHPSDVVGMVLVAPTHEHTRLTVRGQLVQLRTLAQDRLIPPVHTLAEAPPKVATRDQAAACRATAAAAASIVRPYDRLPAQAQRYRVWLLTNPQCGGLQGEDYLPDELAAVAARRERDPQALGAMPLILIAPARLTTPRNVSPDAWRQEYANNMVDLSRLSRQGRVITDTLSGHHVHLDNPSTVVTAIRDVVRTASHRPE